MQYVEEQTQRSVEEIYVETENIELLFNFCNSSFAIWKDKRRRAFCWWCWWF